MPQSELLELAKSGDYDRFEARCLELLEGGTLTLPALVAPFEELDRREQADRLATLTLMVFENVAPESDLQAALTLSRIALIGSPNHAELRRRTSDLHRRLYGQTPGFGPILAASGLDGGRPVRNALKLLDLCLTLQPGDTLICRLDDRVAEVANIEREHGLFTLRRAGRTTTIPAPELARDYDRIAPDDFRVLRQLRPERLTALIHEDPVALVIGLLRAHGGHSDADVLKQELVPKYIDPKEWSRWWTSARNQLKRSPHVFIEGRSPMILSYCAEGQTLAEETWQAIAAQNDAGGWLTTVEGYLREAAARREEPDATLLWRVHDHIVNYIESVRSRRPGEALACALAVGRLSEKGLPTTDDTQALAVTMLRAAAQPGELLGSLENDAFRERGLVALQAARPDDWVEYALAWLPTAPAALLDKLATGAIAAGRTAAIQQFVDAGLNDLPGHTELVYWLWKGPKHAAGLNLPPDTELFRMISDTLSTLGRSVTAEPRVVKEFRHRMKAALSLRDFEKVRRCLKETSNAAAVTIKQQLQRLEGLGDNTRTRLLDILRDEHPELWTARPRQLAPWEDPETVWATSAGLAKRTAERDHIVNVQMHDNARRIGEAAAHGDLSENSEYRFALEERDLLRARLAKVNDELSRARVLDPQAVPTEQVGIGSRVTLRRMDGGGERAMTFFGPFETDVEQGIYSYLSPVGQKLMGRRVGERVTLALEGRDAAFEVAAVASALAVPSGSAGGAVID